MNSIKFLGLVLMLTFSLSACNDKGLQNTAPEADAGVDQHKKTGSIITLDASHSADAQHDTLTYKWSVDQVPIGSAAVLSDENTSHPQFTADLYGIYKFSLIVNDGRRDSSKSTVTITATATTENSLPVAHGGRDQHVKAESPHSGGLVFLDGSGSSDADNEPLTFQWRLIVKPTDSVASLVDANSSHAKFIADISGTYEVDLIVNDGTANSIVDTVIINAQLSNSAPVAHAGDDIHTQVHLNNDGILLDGSGSSDADHDNLTYTWRVKNNEDVIISSFNDNKGQAFLYNRRQTLDLNLRVGDVVVGSVTYVVSLIVNDGITDSVEDVMTVIVSENPPPVAKITSSPFYEKGETVHLSGKNSFDAANDSLTYKWSIITSPGPIPTLSSSTGETTEFVINQEGKYVVTLLVNDGVQNSPARFHTIHTKLSSPVLRSLVDTYISKRTDGEDISHETEKIIHADTSSITDMHELFSASRSGFNLDISGWDTSEVKDMHKMFAEAHNFNYDISGWDVSKVTNHFKFDYASNSFIWPDSKKPHFIDTVTKDDLHGTWIFCGTPLPLPPGLPPIVTDYSWTFNSDNTAVEKDLIFPSLDCPTGLFTSSITSRYDYILGKQIVLAANEITVPVIKEVQELILYAPHTNLFLYKRPVAIHDTDSLYIGAEDMPPDNHSLIGIPWMRQKP